MCWRGCHRACMRSSWWTDTRWMRPGRGLCAAARRRRAVAGRRLEAETLIHVRAAKAGLVIAEVPGYEHSRIHGRSNLNVFSEGIRVLRTNPHRTPPHPAPARQGAVPASLSLQRSIAAPALRRIPSRRCWQPNPSGERADGGCWRRPGIPDRRLGPLTFFTEPWQLRFPGWEVRRCRYGSLPPAVVMARGVLPPAQLVREPLMGTCGLIADS